jgi:hypothetical protein
MTRGSSVSRVSIARTNSARASLLDDAPSASASSSSSSSAPPSSSVGPLTFTSHCLQVAFREAVVLDQLGLQGASSLSWNMVRGTREGGREGGRGGV